MQKRFNERATQKRTNSDNMALMAAARRGGKAARQVNKLCGAKGLKH